MGRRALPAGVAALALAAFLFFSAQSVRAADGPPADVEFSTQPIGTPFYRHLAWDMNLDLQDLIKFEKRGFGRAEIITLIFISKHAGTPLKEFGKRRLKDDVPLETLATEAGLDYKTLYALVKTVKESIEAKGANNLPPAVYMTRKSQDREPPDADDGKIDKKKKKKKD